MRAHAFWIAWATVLVCGSAIAETGDCGDARNTVEMNACADKELTAADADLNKAYRKVLARVPSVDAPAPYDAKGYEAALRAAQRAWVAYRDADCKGVVPFEWGGGTGATAAVLGCLTEKTKARTKDLNESSFGPQ